MTIRKINEGFDVDSMLKGLGLKKDDFDRMITTLKDYRTNLDNADELISDLEEERKSDWNGLRSWKVKNINSRYDLHRRKIEEVDTIRDYVVEMEDEGWKVSLDLRNHTMTFKCTDHPISKLNKLFHFLTHTHRFGFKLRNLQKSSSFTAVEVEYKPRIKTVSDIDEINID